jgi:hypothetical protein
LGVSSRPLPLPLLLLLPLPLEVWQDRFCSCHVYASATAPAGVSGELELGLRPSWCLDNVQSTVCGDGVDFDIGVAAVLTLVLGMVKTQIGARWATV